MFPTGALYLDLFSDGFAYFPVGILAGLLAWFASFGVKEIIKLLR